MASRGGVLLSAASPQEDIWGESILLDLAAPLLELAKRFSQNSQILDKNAKPSRVWHSGTDDAEELFPLTDDDDPDDVTQYQKIAQGLCGAGARGRCVAWRPHAESVVPGIQRQSCPVVLNKLEVCER